MTRLSLLIISGLLIWSTSIAYSQQQPSPQVDRRADEILKRMSQTLAAAKSFTVQTHNLSERMLDNGQKVQAARNQHIALRRPNGISASVKSDEEELEFRYDGKRVMLYNITTKSWGEVPGSASIDQTLDMLAEQYGMALPLADLMFADPYASLMMSARSGTYVGEGYVFDTKCHHLAYRSDVVDWQVWVEVGEKALPRKVVITYKEQPGHPQYISFLSKWELNADVPDSALTLNPPATAKKVEFAATQPSTEK